MKRIILLRRQQSRKKESFNRDSFFIDKIDYNDVYNLYWNEYKHLVIEKTEVYNG